ncbi:MAG: mechanosensitive ion channel family protein [Pseudomonadales bacterium]
MNWTDLLFDWLLPGGATLVIAGVLFWSLRRAIPDEPATRIIRQLVGVAVIVIANIALVLALPFDSTTTGQLLSLFGLVITAVIALSSTTFVSNAMAGLMLRYVGGFHPGDFIRVGEEFGRVTEKGLLHTEIQSEDRDLITLPNLFVMNQPVRVVRSSGTLISADVSLGYDVHRKRVRDRLKEAALDAELSDPFVQITSLGDYSVSYRVYGFLEDVSNLVTKRTDLRSRMLDRLHEDGIEIVSPSFMNQRRLDPAQRLVPASTEAAAGDGAKEDSHAEQLMFDKAEVAARVSELRVKRDELQAELAALDTADESQLERERGWRERQIGYLQDMIDTMEKP